MQLPSTVHYSSELTMHLEPRSLKWSSNYESSRSLKTNTSRKLMSRFCTKCGIKASGAANFCHKCGQPHVSTGLPESYRLEVGIRVHSRSFPHPVHFFPEISVETKCNTHHTHANNDDNILQGHSVANNTLEPTLMS